MKQLLHHLKHCPRCRQRVDREARLFSRRPRVADERWSEASMVYTSMWSPLGTLWLAGGPHGLMAVEYAIDEAQFVHEVQSVVVAAPCYDPGALPEERRQISEYLSGKRLDFDLMLDFSRLSAFKADVFKAVQAIPYAEVQSYGEVAEEIGNPRAARAVGAAVSGCVFSFVVPCHRVVRSGGVPGIYAPRMLGPCGVLYQAGLIAGEQCGK